MTAYPSIEITLRLLMEGMTKYIIIILTLFSLSGIMSTRTNILHFKFLCYENALFELSQKDNRDQPIDNRIYFTICISDVQNGQNCSIRFSKTDTFINQKKVCNQPQDNRESLQSTLMTSLTFQTKNIFYVTVDVKSSKGKTLSKFFTIFFPNVFSSKVRYREIKMKKKEFDSQYSNTSLKIAMALECVDFRNKTCWSSCPPVSNINSMCTNNRKIVCEKDTVCKKVFNICRPNPCKHYGQCVIVPTYRKYACNCKRQYFGDHCENINICIVEPCLNGGACKYDKNNIRFCQCQLGFTGKLCDQATDSRTNTSNAQITIWTVIGVFILLIILGTVLVYFCYLRHRLVFHRDINHGPEIKLPQVSQGLLSDPVVSNNRSMRPISENVYVSINEAETNSAITDMNEYDLLPLAPIYSVPINTNANPNGLPGDSPAKIIKKPSVSKFI